MYPRNESYEKLSLLSLLKPTDVYCGQNATLAKSHHGNIVFRSIVQANSERYRKATRRSEKTMITVHVVEEIHKSGGRFLKTDPLYDDLVELDEAALHDKVSHALRSAKDRRHSVEARHSRTKSICITPQMKPTLVECIEELPTPPTTTCYSDLLTNCTPDIFEDVPDTTHDSINKTCEDPDQVLSAWALQLCVVDDDDEEDLSLLGNLEVDW